MIGVRINSVTPIVLRKKFAFPWNIISLISAIEKQLSLMLSTESGLKSAATKPINRPIANIPKNTPINFRIILPNAPKIVPSSSSSLSRNDLARLLVLVTEALFEKSVTFFFMLSTFIFSPCILSFSEVVSALGITIQRII